MWCDTEFRQMGTPKNHDFGAPLRSRAPWKCQGFPHLHRPWRKITVSTAIQSVNKVFYLHFTLLSQNIHIHPSIHPYPTSIRKLKSEWQLFFDSFGQIHSKILQKRKLIPLREHEMLAFHGPADVKVILVRVRGRNDRPTVHLPLVGDVTSSFHNTLQF